MAELHKMQNYSALGVNLSRQKYGPLDVSNVFYSLTDFKWYLSFSSTNPTGADNRYTHTEAVPDTFKAYPYEGQVVAVVDNGELSVYVLGAEKETADPDTGCYFDYKEVGAAPQGDGSSIEVVDKQIKIRGFGDGYWKYYPGTEGGAGHYEYVEGEWISGLQPQVRLTSDGQSYEIAWYEPNPTTVEGLESRLTAAEGDIEVLKEVTAEHTEALANVYTKGETYNKTEIDSKVAGAFHFKGEAELQLDESGQWTGELIKDG